MVGVASQTFLPNRFMFISPSLFTINEAAGGRPVINIYYIRLQKQAYNRNRLRPVENTV